MDFIKTLVASWRRWKWGRAVRREMAKPCIHGVPGLEWCQRCEDNGSPGEVHQHLID